MSKEMYERAAVEIIRFLNEDVLSGSLPSPGEDELPINTNSKP